MLETIERMARVARVRALGAAQRRPAARDRGAQHLPVVAGIHGVVRAPLHQQRRAAGRRLLRDDARAHPADQGRPSRGAGARGTRARPAAAARKRAPASAAAVRRRCRAREKSRMANTLARGAFIVSVELLPPRGYRRRRARRAGARSCASTAWTWSTFPTVRARSARMSALAAALLVQQQAGVETILHYACRDRNLLGMQSDLLGAHSMGVRNLLLITGDPPQVGDYPGRDRGLRRRFDRPDERRRAAEPRARHRRAGDRPADGVPHRRRG